MLLRNFRRKGLVWTRFCAMQCNQARNAEKQITRIRGSLWTKKEPQGSSISSPSRAPQADAPWWMPHADRRRRRPGGTSASSCSVRKSMLGGTAGGRGSWRMKGQVRNTATSHCKKTRRSSKAKMRAVNQGAEKEYEHIHHIIIIL